VNAPSDPSYALAVADKLLTCSIKHLIWILLQCWTNNVALCDQAVALWLSSGKVVTMSPDILVGHPWEDMTSCTVPNPGAKKPSFHLPDNNVALSQLHQHCREWRALKQFLKSPSQNDGKA
jgi:hypothetical protein